jgi:hypothetical protein
VADDILELLFKVTTADDGGLNRVDQAVKKIGQDSGLTGAALQNLEAGVRKSFESMVQSGLTFEQSLKRISQSGDTIGRGVGNIAKDMVKALNDAATAAGNLQQRQQQLQQSATGLQSALGNPLQAIGTVATNTAAALGPVGIAIIGLATVSTLGAKAMFDLVDAQGRAAQATLNMANQLGISTGSMRQMEVEAKIVGLSFQSMMIASRNLAVGLEDPTGAGRNAAKALNELGVATQTASGAVRGEGQVFQDAIEQLAGIEDQSKRTEEATRLFGSRGSASLVALVARYKELKQATEELGYGSTDQLVQGLAKAQESVNKVSAAWDLFKAKLAEKIAPIVVPVLVKLTAALKPDDPANAIGSKGAQDRATRENQAFYGANGASVFSALFTQLGLTSDQLRGGLGGDRFGGLALADQTRTQELAAGKSITDKFNAEYAKTSEGLAARLRENSDALKKVTDKLALGGLSQSAASDLSAQASSLEAQRSSLEAQKKALEQSQTEVAKLRDDAKYPDLQSPIEFRKLIAERQKELSVVGPGNAGLVDASPTFGTDKINDAIRNFFQKISDEIQKDAAGVVKTEDRFDRGDPDSEAYKKQLKDNLELAKLQYDQSQKQLKIFDDSDRDAARAKRDAAVKLAELSTGGFGGGAGAILTGAQTSISDSQQQFSDRIAEIEQEADAYRQEGGDRLTLQKQLGDLATQQLQAEAELRKEIDAAQLDSAVKLAEYQKQQLDSYKQQGEQIFDALRQRGGIQQYFRGQVTDLAKGVFSNVTAPVLQQIGQSLGSAGSAIGGNSGIFRGTALDPSRAESPQVRSLDLNRASLDKNTAALGNITRIYGGGSSAAPAGSAPSSLLRTPGFLPSSTASAAGADPLSDIEGFLGGAGGVGPVAGATATLTDAISTNTDATNKLTATYSGTPVGGQAASVQSGSVGASLTKLVGGGGSGGGSDNQFLDGLLGIFGGKGGIGGGGLFAGLNSNAGMTGTYRAGNIISSAADVGTGIYESVNQFSKGGVAGIAGGLGAASLTAGQLAGGPSNPLGLGLDIFGGVMELFKGLLPNPADIRAAQIANQTAYNQYVAPPQINQALNQAGFQTYTDKTGQVQASAYSSIQETQPYKYLSPIPQPIGSLYQNWVSAPGQIIEPYQAPAATPTYAQQPGVTYTTTVNLQSWDSNDVGSFVNKNSASFASAVQKEVQNGHPVGLALQSALVGT